MGGMSKASTDPFCLAPLRQRETRLDGSEGVGLLSAHSTPKKRWCKRCNSPIGNLIQTLLPAVILMLQGKIAKQVSPYPSILTLIIGGNYTLRSVLANQHCLCNLRILLLSTDKDLCIKEQSHSACK